MRASVSNAVYRCWARRRSCCSSSVRFENTGDTGTNLGPFTRHVMTDERDRAIQLEAIPGPLVDGRDGGVGSNHVNTVSGDPEPLSVTATETATGGP